MKRAGACAALVVAGAAIAAALQASRSEPQASEVHRAPAAQAPAPLQLPPDSAHRVWVPDRLWQRSALFDGDTGRMLGIRRSRPGGHTALDVRQHCDHDQHGYPPEPRTHCPAPGRCPTRMIGGIMVGQSHHEKDQDQGGKQHKHLGHPSLRIPLPPVEHLCDADQKRPALFRYPRQELLECPLTLLGNTAHRLFYCGVKIHGDLLHRGLDDRGGLACDLGHGLVDRRPRLRRELGR